MGADYQTAPPLFSLNPSCGACFTEARDVFSMNNSLEDEGDMRVASEEVPRMNFSKLLTYIIHCFPEAKGLMEK